MSIKTRAQKEAFNYNEVAAQVGEIENNKNEPKEKSLFPLRCQENPTISLKVLFSIPSYYYCLSK